MKTWYQSKTVWLGIITILVAALTQFSGIVESPDLKNGILAVVGLLNVLLRVFSTAQPIEPASEVDRFKGR